MIQGAKIDVSEDVMHNYALDFLRYGEKISIVSLKDCFMIMVLSGYVPAYPIIGSQT